MSLTIHSMGPVGTSGGTSMAFARRARRLAPTIVVAVVASVIVAFAVHAIGNVVQRPDLNNSGIWASSLR